MRAIFFALILTVTSAQADDTRDRLIAAITGLNTDKSPPPFFQEDPSPPAGNADQDAALRAYSNKANTDAAIAREAFILGGPAVAAQPHVPAPSSNGLDVGAILNGAMKNYDREYREYQLNEAIRAQENRNLLMPE